MQAINTGDTVTYWIPWREDELPENPTGTGKVLAVHKSQAGHPYLQLEGRDRLLPIDRVILVSKPVVGIAKAA